MKKIAIIKNRDSLNSENYFSAIEACGAEAIPFLFQSVSGLKDVDGVLLPGGVDVDPSCYHEENTASSYINKKLDHFELRVIKEALAYGKPILGTCRGMQLLNVYFGGDLCQDIEHHDIHTWTEKGDRVHSTRVKKGSFLDDIYHSSSICVNSAHHQAVQRLGEGLIPIQFSEDGLTEALCHSSLPIFAVQWHPERMCLEHARKDTECGLEVFRYFLSQIEG